MTVTAAAVLDAAPNAQNDAQIAQLLGDLIAASLANTGAEGYNTLKALAARVENDTLYNVIQAATTALS